MGSTKEPDVRGGRGREQEWPEGWAAEVPPGVGAAGVLAQLVGSAAGVEADAQADDQVQGADQSPEFSSTADMEPSAAEVVAAASEPDPASAAGIEPATAEMVVAAPAAPDSAADIAPDATEIVAAAQELDPALATAVEPAVDVPQPVAVSLPTAAPIEPAAPKPPAPRPSPHPAGHAGPADPAGHRRRIAVGVGGAAAFIAVAMAATLSGGGSSSTPPHASRQADALGTPGALVPPLGTSEPASAADAATVADAAQTGAPDASSPTPSSATDASTTGDPTPPTDAAGDQPAPAVQSHPNPAATTAPQAAPAPTTTAAAPPPAPPVTYSAITGWACQNNGSAAFRPVGESDGTTDGWKILTGDDGTGSGCSHGFLAMPMSGDAGVDAANHSDWTFTISPVATGTCRIQVYVPRPSSSAAYEAGGTSALYGVYNGPSVAGLALVDTFRVDQAADRGGSVTVSVPVSRPILRVRLHDQGVDYTSTPKLMYGVAAVRVTCTGTG